MAYSLFAIRRLAYDNLLKVSINAAYNIERVIISLETEDDSCWGLEKITLFNVLLDMFFTQENPFFIAFELAFLNITPAFPLIK